MAPKERLKADTIMSFITILVKKIRRVTTKTVIPGLDHIRLWIFESIPVLRNLCSPTNHMCNMNSLLKTPVICFQEQAL